ncbi:hypothetical protein ON010_g14226 [Phytophthora cinnamomi]|nr:hypothetical protein ON010_g14226 [Phytophthora cinnamomi]
MHVLPVVRIELRLPMTLHFLSPTNRSDNCKKENATKQRNSNNQKYTHSAQQVQVGNPAPTRIVDGGHVQHQVHEAVRVAPLVVVPRHQLHERVVKSNARVRVERARVLVVQEVVRHHLVLRVAEDAGQLALRRGLHGGLDRVHGRRLLQTARQVHHRHVGRRHAERHARQLAVQHRQHLAHGLGGARRRRDDVLAAATAAAPVLAALRRAVHGKLRRRRRVHGRHQTLHDAELVVDHLGQRRQAVRRARRVRHHGRRAVVLLVVHAHHVHGRGVLGRRRDHHLLAAALDVGLGLLRRREHARRLAHVRGAGLAPRDLGRVARREHVDHLAVHHQVAVLRLHGAVELAVRRVVLEQVRHVLQVHERVVDGHHLGLGVLDGGAAHEAADAAEAVDADGDLLRHGCSRWVGGLGCGARKRAK